MQAHKQSIYESIDCTFSLTTLIYKQEWEISLIMTSRCHIDRIMGSQRSPIPYQSETTVSADTYPLEVLSTSNLMITIGLIKRVSDAF